LLPLILFPLQIPISDSACVGFHLSSLAGTFIELAIEMDQSSIVAATYFETLPPKYSSW
jgi:hypothetical protein